MNEFVTFIEFNTSSLKDMCIYLLWIVFIKWVATVTLDYIVKHIDSKKIDYACIDSVLTQVLFVLKFEPPYHGRAWYKVNRSCTFLAEKELLVERENVLRRLKK